MPRVPSAFIDIGEYRVYSSTSATFRALSAVEEIFERATSINEALEDLLASVSYVAERRPTAILLFNAMRRIVNSLYTAIKGGASKAEASNVVSEQVNSIKREIERAVSVTAALGARRVRDGLTLLTCSYSEVVKAFFSRLKSENKKVNVYVTESRPGGEGVLLAQELSDMGFNAELIVDSAVRHFMKDVDLVVTGAEAIAANGAVVNKVGTSLIALAAHEARVRTFVLATTHKFSEETIFGELVKLPIQSSTSILPGLERYKDINVRYPLFDVTPPRYVDAIVTERGVVAPEAVILLVREIYGWPSEISDPISRLRALIEAKGHGGAQ